MIYPHGCGHGTAKGASIGTSFAGLSGQRKWDKRGMIVLAAKWSGSPQVAEHKDDPEPVHKHSDELRLVACEVAGSPSKPAAAHPEPPVMSKPRGVVPIKWRGIPSLNRQARSSHEPRARTPLPQTGPLRRDMVKKLIDDVRPKPGSVMAMRPKSDDDTRAFLYCYQTACITYVPLKPLHLGQPAGNDPPIQSSPVSGHGGKSVERGSASAQLTATSSNPAESTAIRADKSDVVGERKAPSQYDDRQDPADHTRYVNKSDMPGDDSDDTESLNSDGVGRHGDAPYPRSASSAGSSPDSTPPSTPVDINACFMPHRHTLVQRSDFTIVDVDGALCATY